MGVGVSNIVGEGDGEGGVIVGVTVVVAVGLGAGGVTVGVGLAAPHGTTA